MTAESKLERHFPPRSLMSRNEVRTHGRSVENNPVIHPRVMKLLRIASILFVLLCVGFLPAAAQSWPNGYGYRRTITIDHTKVSNTDQITFPVLISGTYSYLATTGNGGNVTSSNGYDIIFTSDAAGINTLPFEQESYSATTGAVNYWVQ